MPSDIGSNRAAWLVAGFLGRKIMKDMLGRWSLIPVLVVGLCWWRTQHCESKIEKDKLEKLRRKTRQSLHSLRKSSLKGAEHLAASKSSSASSCDEQQRRPGDRLGGIPGSPAASTAKRGEHLSPSAATGSVSGAPKDALASELWAWLGGMSVPRVCGADRPRSRSAGGGGTGGAGEWRGAFTNRMGNLPRRNAFKTARGKVYLRSGNRRPGGAGDGDEAASEGILESVREEDEGSMGA